MNLMKWFRKNNKKIMAIVVVVIMFGFIAGPTLRYFARIRTGWHESVAYFADNKEITRSDLISAHQELEILRHLSIDGILKTQDLRGILLGELLFTEQRMSPALLNHIQRMITTDGYRISNKQISDIYRRPMPSDYYWLLLTKEAQLAGIKVTKENAGTLLGQIIPQLFRGATYSQVIKSLIDGQGIPEGQVLEVFGKLLAILQYSQMICSGEDVTSSQIMHMASQEMETINVELTEFNSSVFAENLSEPNEAKLVEHFDKYKKFFAGSVSEENPYGFGYKLHDRVQLEYIAIKLDDVSQIVATPTPQEKEQYYQKNIGLFTREVPSDPNDPNSLKVRQTKSYAEVASYISDKLLQDKADSKAKEILQEVRTLTETSVEDTMDEQQPGDYTAIAEQLSKKYNIKIYEGQTGLLSITDMQADKHLRTLRMRIYGNQPVVLPHIVYDIEELKDAEFIPFWMLKPKLYENIGPLRDFFGNIIVLVRLVKAEKACEPQSINQTFNADGLILDPNETQADGQLKSENTYSIREKVVEDLKNLAAMDTTRSKAEEFVKLAEKDGWDSALNKFNDLYGKQAKEDPNDPNVFRLHRLTDLQRISNAILATLTVQNAGNPLVQFIINDATKQAQFIDKLYSLVPQDSNSIDSAGLIMEFKPDMSFYIIKDISVNRLDQAKYEKIKAQRLYQEDHIQIQNAAAEYFNPENIIKRMNFRWAERDEETTDANTPAGSVRLSLPSKSEELS